MIKPKKTRPLEALMSKMLYGTAVETFRTCGKARCVCREGQRHGPYLRLTCNERGRIFSQYVGASQREAVLEGVRAWHSFQEIAREIAEENRRRLLGERKRLRARRAR